MLPWYHPDCLPHSTSKVASPMCAKHTKHTRRPESSYQKVVKVERPLFLAIVLHGNHPPALLVTWLMIFVSSCDLPIYRKMIQREKRHLLSLYSTRYFLRPAAHEGVLRRGKPFRTLTTCRISVGSQARTRFAQRGPVLLYRVVIDKHNSRMLACQLVFFMVLAPTYSKNNYTPFYCSATLQPKIAARYNYIG